MADFGASLVATRISWTYVDPNAGETLRGDEIGESVEETIQGFPDVHFEEDRVMQTEIEGEFGLVVEWTMHGTHDGPLEGLPPTGNAITLDGVDIVTVSEDGITSITQRVVCPSKEHMSFRTKRRAYAAR